MNKHILVSRRSVNCVLMKYQMDIKILDVTLMECKLTLIRGFQTKFSPKRRLTHRLAPPEV